MLNAHPHPTAPWGPIAPGPWDLVVVQALKRVWAVDEDGSFLQWQPGQGEDRGLEGSTDEELELVPEQGQEQPPFLIATLLATW